MYAKRAPGKNPTATEAAGLKRVRRMIRKHVGLMFSAHVLCVG